MKVIAVNGSPRKNGNTASLIRHVLAALDEEGIDTEHVQLAGKKIRGCIACMKCFENKNQRCAVDTDALNGVLEKMIAADGIILGSPTYFADVTAEMKALIDRTGMVALANDAMLKRKLGAAVVAVRRAGSTHVFDSINHLFTISQMIIPGASYWNMGIGFDKGEVDGDEEGVRTMRVLGENMAWLLRKIHR